MYFIEQFCNYLSPVLSVLIQVGICIGVFVIISYGVRTLKEKGVDLVNDTNISELIDLEEIVIKVVRFLNQTVVDKLKESSPNGKLTDEQINNIQSEAMNLIYKFLNSEMIDAITNKYGEDYDTYIKLLIENTVINEKDTKVIKAEPLTELISCDDTISNK